MLSVLFSCSTNVKVQKRKKIQTVFRVPLDLTHCKLVIRSIKCQVPKQTG